MLPDLSGRSFLLLQGPQSGFFRELAKGLREAGALVEKVNFCGGDVLLWGIGHAFCYRGTRYEWLSWVGKIYRGRHITDICVYGDWRPMHWEAIRLADTLGIRIWVYEEGYLRNSYSTLEEFGVNGRSRLPKTAPGIRALSQHLGHNTTLLTKSCKRSSITRATSFFGRFSGTTARIGRATSLLN